MVNSKSSIEQYYDTIHELSKKVRMLSNDPIIKKHLMPRLETPFIHGYSYDISSLKQEYLSDDSKLNQPKIPNPITNYDFTRVRKQWDDILYRLFVFDTRQYTLIERIKIFKSLYKDKPLDKPNTVYECTQNFIVEIIKKILYDIHDHYLIESHIEIKNTVHMIPDCVFVLTIEEMIQLESAITLLKLYLFRVYNNITQGDSYEIAYSLCLSERINELFNLLESVAGNYDRIKKKCTIEFLTLNNADLNRLNTINKSNTKGVKKIMKKTYKDIENENGRMMKENKFELSELNLDDIYPNPDNTEQRLINELFRFYKNPNNSDNIINMLSVSQDFTNMVSGCDEFDDPGMYFLHIFAEIFLNYRESPLSKIDDVKDAIKKYLPIIRCYLTRIIQETNEFQVVNTMDINEYTMLLYTIKTYSTFNSPELIVVKMLEWLKLSDNDNNFKELLTNGILIDLLS